jgi:hypothetical protein
MQVYKFCGSLLLLAWCWGLNVYMFNMARINYIYIFEFRPQDCLSWQEIFEKALVWTIAFLLNFLFFYKMVRNDLGTSIGDGQLKYAYFFPFAIWLSLVLRVFAPICWTMLCRCTQCLIRPVSILRRGVCKSPGSLVRAPQWREQKQLFTMLFKVATAPFHEVRFRDAYAADVLTSLPKVFSYGALSTCFFLSGQFLQPETSKLRPSAIDAWPQCRESVVINRVVIPCLSVLPLWFRFCQNLRRYYDAKLPAADEGEGKLGGDTGDSKGEVASNGLAASAGGVAADSTREAGAKSSEGLAGGLLASALAGCRHPHLTNALKYALAMTVTVFGVANPYLQQSHWQQSATSRRFRAVWLFVFFLSTLYSWAWDCAMDWGLWRHRRWGCSSAGASDSPRRWLRAQLMYAAPHYYGAMVADLLLRFLWTLSLIPSGHGLHPFSEELQTVLAPVLAGLEILRRTMWGCFRLENEHLHNCASFRKVDFVPTHFESDPLTAAAAKKGKGTAQSKGSKSSSKTAIAESVIFATILLGTAGMALHWRFGAQPS